MHRCARFAKIRPYSKMSDEAFLLLYAVFLATWLQHGPKMLSGRARARTRAHMHRCARFPEKVEISKNGFCEAFLLRPTRGPKRPQDGLNTDPKPSKKQKKINNLAYPMHFDSKMAPKMAKEASIWPQDAPRGPKMAPTDPKLAPRRPKLA